MAVAFPGPDFPKGSTPVQSCQVNQPIFKGSGKIIKSHNKVALENDMPPSLQLSTQNSKQCYHSSSRVEVVPTIIAKSLKHQNHMFYHCKHTAKKVWV